MYKGRKVVLTTIQGPHGKLFESLLPEFAEGAVGRVTKSADTAGYIAIQFPGVTAPLQAHLTMVKEPKK